MHGEGGSRVRISEKERKNWKSTRRELKRIWKCKEVTIVSVIFGTLGMVSISRLRKRLEALDVAKEVELLLGTARILRRVLDTGY